LAGCASADKPTLLSTPVTARPKPIANTSANMGSLYPANEGGPYDTRSYRPLFEDRRARNVGDTLTIVLNETTSAAKNSNMLAERKASTSSNFGNTSTTPNGIMTSVANIANFAGSGDLKNEGTGASAVNNTFAGTITCTVIEVLSNGNLVVAGEKQVAVSNEKRLFALAVWLIQIPLLPIQCHHNRWLMPGLNIVVVALQMILRVQVGLRAYYLRLRRYDASI